jgi:galactokinase/mevalonate kinase-like predicted kinase
MTTDSLISLTPSAARHFAKLRPRSPRCFVACDPDGHQLGSGGGTIHLLRQGWQAGSRKQSFVQWLRQSRKLVIHAGGQSRRLPAYAPVGKALIPMPVLRWSRGQRLDQTLLDLQTTAYESLLDRAPSRTVASVTSGDVLLRWGGQLPAVPDADVVVVGMWVRPELASHHGVLFCPRGEPGRLAFMLQKPSAERIRELANEHVFLIDTGAWLLSERAIQVLQAQCARGKRYELYGDFGLSLGQHPTERNRAVNELSCAVLALPQGEFYHFGTNRSLIESVSVLQNRVLDQTKFGAGTAKPHPDQYTQNSIIHAAITPANHTLWIENSRIPATWQLTTEHVLTGIPENDWSLRLQPGACLDFVPLDARRVCVRSYRFDDSFRGPVGREIAEALGIPTNTDLQFAPLFPVLSDRQLNPQFVQWLADGRPAHAEFCQLWRATPRLSAQDLLTKADLPRLATQRAANLQSVLAPLAQNHERSVFYNLDLDATAKLFARARLPVPPLATTQPLKQVQELMFRSAIKRTRRQHGAGLLESQAFARLREAIIHETAIAPSVPRRNVLEDQIVWGRSPVRLDLAGGWTDTPPYCLQHGGRVVNLAVNLNGQPPIQVFARLSQRPELVVRSIDLGVEERIRTYSELSRYDRVGSGFSVAKAALALAGFLPPFNPTGCATTLTEQLRAFGGGIEISLLCAVPKGSGLGTSSILAATLLGTLSDLCGLGWDLTELSRRTLALEQMLTTGGGWQDQAGGLLHGIKLLETEPGLSQKPVVRWLPEQLFAPDRANRTVLLYYTGITRVAKDILQEIVRGMFLNSQRHLAVLADIGANAQFTCDALQRSDAALLNEAVRRSWQLNQQLDRDTNPPAVQAALAPIAGYLSAAKLLGAGGGGYLLLFAKDDEAAHHIRRTLHDNPPNAKARFVDFSVSATGLQVTRS